MKNKKLKRLSLINLIAGYAMLALFILLVSLNRSTELTAKELEFVEAAVITEEELDAEDYELFDGAHETETIYIEGHPTTVLKDYGVGRDHSRGIILGDDKDNVIVVRDLDNHDNVAVVRGINDGLIVLDDDRNVVIRDLDTVGRDIGGVGGPSMVANGEYVMSREAVQAYGPQSDLIDHGRGVHHGSRVDIDDRVGITVHDDETFLDRRLQELDDLIVDEENITIDEDKVGIGVDGLTGLKLADDNDEDLEFNIEDFDSDGTEKGGYGLAKGNLYAYNFPSQGVGAGIGNAGVGAAAGFAGIGAGIGEAVLNGETVPTLGGIGTTPLIPANIQATPENDKDKDGLPASVEAQIGTNPNNPDTDGDGLKDGDEVASYSNPLDRTSTPFDPGSTPLPQVGGVGGLMNGAGAGAAAGIVTGTVKEQLGLGAGCKEHGPECNGLHDHGLGGHRGHYNFDHLPKDGALHIMIHVDGSGSILSTRKQLDIMKETLLKQALLPYYNNDASLYNKRVTIVDNAEERTLQFFADAASKDNVLAIAFQDEAAPDYHLPTFNKAPQPAYSTDLNKLKSKLNGYGGLYRGIMFQVDRGRTFARSFKEMVECAWNGEGYLEEENLRKYHRDNNLHNIKHKSGIVFSDEYHAKSEGDPQYYLDLLFKASKRIGLDLNIYGAGLADGKYNNKLN